MVFRREFWFDSGWPDLRRLAPQTTALAHSKRHSHIKLVAGPLWLLGIVKRAHPDLNQGPADLQSAALTTELCTQMLLRLHGQTCARTFFSPIDSVPTKVVFEVLNKARS